MVRTAARKACEDAGLDERAAGQLLLALCRLTDHLLLKPARVGVVRVDSPCEGGRPGVEIEARLQCSDWAVDLPPIAGLVDELDAGFTKAGEIRVWARKWRRGDPPAPVKTTARGRRASAPA